MRFRKFLSASPIVSLVVSAQLIERQIKIQLRDHALTLNQALILTALFFEENHQARPTEIAKVFGTTKSNMSHQLASLESRKLVSRKVASTDNRQQPVKLTAAGERLCQKLIPYFDRMQNQLEKRLGGENPTKTFNMSVRHLASFFERP